MRSAVVSSAAIAVAMMAAAGSASAATVVFTPGGSVNPTNTVINDFNAPEGNVSGTFQLKNPPADSSGAPPASGDGSQYLSVLGGNSATIALPTGIKAFAFEWGSLDGYNTLTVNTALGAVLNFVPGLTLPSGSNGDQLSPSTNGLFRLTADANDSFTSIVLGSTSNSFEIDNLVAVPEPSTWALMILGIGAAGAVMRRRRQSVSVRYA